MRWRSQLATCWLPGPARIDGQWVTFDVLDEHPDDGFPWLGVVEIHADGQGRGLGWQCVRAIAHRAGVDLKARSLRAAADDTGAQMFLSALGFSSVGARARASPQGRGPAIIYEAKLFSEPRRSELGVTQ